MAERLEKDTIQKYVGKTSFVRGRAYANRGSVKSIKYEPEQKLLKATVSGSGRKPYEVEVTFREQSDGNYSINDSDCTCPVGFACKHVAAAALKALSNININVTMSATNADRIKRAPEAELVPTPPLAAPSKRTASPWRAQVLGLLDKSQAQHDDYVQLGLAIESKQQADYSKRLPEGGYARRQSLLARPIMFNPESGKWVKTGVTWNQISYGSSFYANGYQLKQIDESQRQWFLELAALDRISTSRFSYYDPQNIDFLAFQHAELWHLLQRAQKKGVALLFGKNTHYTPVELAADTLKYGMHIAAAPGAGMHLHPAMFDASGQEHSGEVGFMGRPAHMAYTIEAPQKSGAVLTFFALDKNVPEEAVAAYEAKEIIHVPADEQDQFVREVYPAMTQFMTVQAADAVTEGLLPKVYPPKLRMRVLPNEQRHVLKVVFDWQYGVSEMVQYAPLYTQAQDSVLRDILQETSVLEKVIAHTVSIQGLRDAGGQLPASAQLQGIDAVNFIQIVLPELQNEPDVITDIQGELPAFEEWTEPPTIEVSVQQAEGSGTDWFDLGVVVKLGDEEVPFEALFTALADGETHLLLMSGRYVRLDQPQFDKLRQLIEEARSLQDKASGELRLSPYQASLWDELAALGVVTAQAEAWDSSVRGLLDVQFVPKVLPPKQLKAKLRPYQLEGYQWLHFLHEHRLGGVLADDMGLGKTLQTIALLVQIQAAAAAKKRGCHLIVAPTSVAVNWVSELERFAPHLRTVYIRSKQGGSKAMKQLVKHADVIVTSYNLLRLNEEEYEAVAWATVVLDEAQFVKNHQSKSYNIVRKLPSDFKLALTGTPMENNLMELWALLSIAAPGLFPSPKRFADFYQRPIEKENNAEVLAQLRRRIRPLMLRRTKDQVVAELPPKVEQTIELELAADHRKVYDVYLQRERQRVLGMIGDMQKNRFAIFKSLMTLRRLSLDARLIDPKKHARTTPTKLNGFLETIEPVISEGHRAIVFSQFTGYLSLVRQALEERGITYVYLDGSTRNRAEVLADFKQGEVPVFLISLKAGGFGLNLTEADYCFLLDPWWNPAVEQQAVDRTHRIGQKRSVTVYRLVAKGTIEEKVMALKAKKAKLFASVLGDEAAFSAALTADDIRGLFEG